ncbi:ribosomal RNA small subunit methyltransferase A [Candidatus Kaiserbacteria bacterium]|nr:ribosomal RNA small subunit methyltransferase A [Candidatus Kaiserbacteria bacterium]
MSKSFVTKKSLGQNFLTSDVVPLWMCEAAHLEKDDVVLEIGPGIGALTKVLLDQKAKVIALEADIRAIEILNNTFAKEIKSGQLTMIHGDVRELNINDLPIGSGGYKVVANIPYYLSGFLFRFFLESSHQPALLVFLVQKEVAKRITSNFEKGDKESILSISVKVYGQPKYIKTVSKGHFSPPPKIDSGIVAIYNINKNNFKDLSENFFFDQIHLGFGQKRKQLLGNLTKIYPRESLLHTFSTLSLPTTVRAEDLSLEKWLELTKSLKLIS